MYGVDLALLVAKNKRKWPGLTKVARLKRGTDLRLPLPEDTLESIQYDGKCGRTRLSARMPLWCRSTSTSRLVGA
jgi:hypothetical protein